MTVGGLFAVTLLAGSAAAGRTSLGALAEQVCMIAMVLAPILVVAALAMASRRALSASR